MPYAVCVFDPTSRLVTTVYHLSSIYKPAGYPIRFAALSDLGAISVMSSMECSKIRSSKFSQLNRILSRQSAFGNETGKLAIGEYW
jgi:hypothetical protein